MQDNPLHIVSFDNPFPPVYGGIVEVFYKLKPLSELGFQIHFHCFTDHIPQNNPELDAVVEKVYYYKKQSSPFAFFSRLPFSVNDRKSPELLENLKKINAPILFEGLKTTHLVYQDKLEGFHKILRLHNIEHHYFNGIAKSETNIFKKLIFLAEGIKYRKYEKVIDKFQKIVTLSCFENGWIHSGYGNSSYVPVFHGNEQVENLGGIGKYALYHGDLRMSDNKKAVRLLISIFRNIPDFRLVITSSNGKNEVEKWIGKSSHISFVTLEDFNHLKNLLKEAHINLMLSFQQSGTKLKLMNALYNSRFCIINENITDDPIVSGLCEFAFSESEITSKIKELQNKEFENYERRKVVLEEYMNDRKNAALLADKIVEKWN